MSNRFYINDFQPFSNNELGKKTYEELNRQGIKWVEDGWCCKKQKITDPQALLDAINEDILSDLKESVTTIYNEETWEKTGEKPWEEINDADLYTNKRNTIKNTLFTKDGLIRVGSWEYLDEFISSKKAFTPTFVYLAIKDCCEWKDGKLVLKPRRNIYVEMY